MKKQELNTDSLVEGIKVFLKRNKMTQADFSRMIVCPESTVNRWLHGKRKISPAWVRLITIALAKAAVTPRKA